MTNGWWESMIQQYDEDMIDDERMMRIQPIDWLVGLNHDCSMLTWYTVAVTIAMIECMIDCR